MLKNIKLKKKKIIASNIIIIGILDSIHIKVNIFFINKKDGDPITWCLTFFIFLTIF